MGPIASRRVAVALATMLAVDAVSFVAFRDIHHEHHQKLGVSPILERVLPALKGTLALGLSVTADRPRPRAVVAAGGVRLSRVGGVRAAPCS